MKKGYIFIMDGIFAVILLVIGIIIVSSNKVEQTTEIPLAIALENSVSLLDNVRITYLCDGCNCSVKKLSELCTKGNIKNREQSIMDYIGELYSRGKEEHNTNGNITEAYLLLYNLSVAKDIFSEKKLYDVEIDIGDQRIYPPESIIDNETLNSEKKKTSNLLSSRRISFGYYEIPETGEIRYWGPYEVKFILWEKQ